MMDVDQIEELFKEIIRLMPIREHIEKFKVDIKLLDHEIDQFAERLDTTSKQLKEPPSNPDDDSSESDVSSLDDEAGNFDSVGESEKEKENRPNRPKKINVLKNASAYMLEEKISTNQEVYAMVKPRKPWVRCQVLQIIRKFADRNLCRPVFKFKLKTIGEKDSSIIFADKFSIALIQDHGDMLRPTKRVIAGYSPSVMMPGIVGYAPDDKNKNRYMVHMDDRSANYFKPEQVYPIFGQSAIPWKDTRRLLGINPDSIEHEAYLNYFYRSYPKNNLLTASLNQKLTVKRKGQLVTCKVVGKDCELFRVLYDDNVEESIYGGNSRFSMRTEEVVHRMKFQNPLLGIECRALLFVMSIYTNASKISLEENIIHRKSSEVQSARKSTASRKRPTESVNLDGVSVFENRSVIKEWDTDKFENLKSHKCSPECLNVNGVETETSVTNLMDNYRSVSDLKIPLCLGWKRELYRFPPNGRKSSGSNIQVVYEAPCGKLLRTMLDVRNYLIRTESKFDIDYFSLDRDLVMNRAHGKVGAFHYRDNIAVDEHNKPLENKCISLINQFTEERLAFDFEYRSQTQPHSVLKKRGFSFNKEFKSGCDCEGDCYKSRSSCSCHILNEEASDLNTHLRGTVDKKCQYSHKRLSHQVVTGIFECNEYCKCSSKCPNRVVQNGIRFRLQVRKTLKKGWGVIPLDDIPAGAFICTYSAELLDDADQYGDSDMYYADLDFITVNEQQKEGYDSDKDEGVESAGSDDDTPPIEPDSKKSRDENGAHPGPVASHSRYPKRRVREEIRGQKEQDLIERVRKTPFCRIHEVLDSHDYTLDARVQGNVGRFFNHSCDPNTFVQNVFIDTHDLRFPVVAFFAQRHIKAHDEITWNYNYSMGAIAGRRIDCHCEAANCRGRIL